MNIKQNYEELRERAMEPNEVIRRFEEVLRRHPHDKPSVIIFQQLCPYSFGLTPREQGFFRKLAMMENAGKINLEAWK